MKKFAVTFVLSSAGFLYGAPLTVSQNKQDLPAPTAYSAVEQGANHRIWERYTFEKAPDGRIVRKAHRYTELASGLNYWKDGQWVESKEVIDILPNGGAAATQGQHQVYFPGDIYQGVIEMVTPDGKHLKSQPMGLSYFDGQNSVLIAQLKDSIGILVSSNQVIYPDAFTDFKADLRYTYTKSGFEQDIILQESPLTPESYGLNPETARLEVLTEFFDPPQPSITESPLPEQAGVALTDETLDFGDTEMIPGRAFLLGSDAEEGDVRVSKKWLLLDGRQFLVEEVPVEALADQLATLPGPQLASDKLGTKIAQHVASAKIQLPPSHLWATEKNRQRMQLAVASKPAKGVVLDYQTVSGTINTNFTFQSDTTYYISGQVTLTRTNTFEGGTVIKYATNTANAAIIINSTTRPTKWQAESYRPIIFTAKDDDSMGEIISGSTGNPSGYYSAAALYFQSGGMPAFSNFRFIYQLEGIHTEELGVTNILFDGQFVNCGFGGHFHSSTAPVKMINILFANVLTNFYLPSANYFDLENVTFVNTLKMSGSSGQIFHLTNCILACVTNLNSTFDGDHNGLYNSPVLGANTLTNTFFPFQTVGAGSYYLASGCSFYDAGTTNIDSTLFADLRRKTTYPPLVDPTIIDNLGPQAPRDNSGTPDLGYHYDPLDYIIVSELDTALTIMPGTAVAHGAFTINANLTVNGNAANPCWFVGCDTVQESSSTNFPNGPLAAYLFGGDLIAHFTRWSGLANEASIFFNPAEVGVPGRYYATNCEFYSGNIYGDFTSYNFDNCLLFRVDFDLDDSDWCSLQNCLFENGDMRLNDNGNREWTIVNTVFDGTSITVSLPSPPTNFTYNAYLQGADRLRPETNNDMIVTSYNWQTNWFGNYYLPPNSQLTNAGSTTADQVGLYHFTTQTNQVKETNSVVDIGYHYVTADANGNPLDSDGDGIPDYLEDSNGNGVFDTGDFADWTKFDTGGNGFSDGWAQALGLDPTINNPAQSGERSNYIYDPVDWLEQISGIRSGSVGLDPEGNVNQSSQ